MTTPSAPPPVPPPATDDTSAERPIDAEPLVLVMVGKPARGKSYTAGKLRAFLTWLGYRARVFNVGAYRRRVHGAGQAASWFDPDNPVGRAARRALATQALDDLVQWMHDGGDVGIYDATNSTRHRRDWVLQTCTQAGLPVVFVELQCEDPDVLEQNIRLTKLHNPDYAERDPDEAVTDFKARLANYERAYEPLSLPEDDDRSWIRVVDAGRHVELHAVRGYLPVRLSSFLASLHLVPRTVWLTRHGESLDNLDGRIGGDSALSERGRIYPRSLRAYVDEHAPDDLQVWTSSLQRTIQTAAELGRPTRQWKLLDELDAGVMDGLTYEEIRARHPDVADARGADKLRYRYPQGESYEDVIARLEPVILELERSRSPVLIVAHQAVLRALYGYLQERARDEVPHLSMPLHTVVRLEPSAYGVHEERIPLAPRPDAHPRAGG